MSQTPPHNPENDDFYNLSPEEQHLENELLKLKMMAEKGATFVDGGTSNDPIRERQFLERILAFEENIRNNATTNFATSVGRPSLPPFDELKDTSTATLDKLIKEAFNFYTKKGVDIGFKYKYPPETVYKFLVEELPDLPNYYGKGGKGFIIGVLYEEHHPNYGGDLQECFEDFIEEYEGLDIAGLKRSFADYQQVNGTNYPTQDMMERLKEHLETIDHVSHLEYTLQHTSYQMEYAQNEHGEEEAVDGAGFVEGIVNMTLQLKNGEEQYLSGPFKIDFHYHFGWEIVFAHFPGINYQ